MDWSHLLAQRSHNIKPSAIREMLKLTQQPDVISFAGGLPAPAVFPINAFRDASETVLVRQGREALQYSTTEGHAPLREWIAQHSPSPNLDSNNIMMTNGSQQCLDLVGKMLLNPGDKVVVAEPTYVGALRAFDAYEVEYLSVDSDDEGVTLDGLAKALEQKPKLIYVIPNFDNPTGKTMGLARRRGLIALAKEQQVPIFEDDPYGALRFEGEALPKLVSLDSDIVISAGSFSKILSPGLRLAWLQAPTALMPLALRCKQACDLHSSSLSQMIVSELLQAKDFFPNHIAQVRQYYREQRDSMLRALKEHMPQGVSWTHPQGGMFLWLELPTHLDSQDLLQQAVTQKVAYVPGEPFFANGGGHNTLRMSYSVASAEQIARGVQTLAQVIAEALD